MAHAIIQAEDFDIGPLTWVKDEIDRALDSVLENVAAVAAAPADTTPLRYSQTHLYQVSGALDMVGLAGCKHFCEALERCVEQLENGALAATQESLQTLSRGVQALRVYLRELLDGAPDLPLRLFPALQALAELHGETLEESVLFFPDLEQRAPRDLPWRELDEAEYAIYIAEQRTLFQKSLLRWLKDGSAEGLNEMRRAIDHVQQVQPPKQRTLWWVAAAFTDALLQDAIGERPGARRLCRRLDQQLRSSGQGAARAAANLLRDLLYYVALCAPLGERIIQVKSVFELDALLPGNMQPLRSSAESAAARQQALEALQAAMEPLKTTWAAASAQQSGTLDPFLRQLGDLVEPSQQLGNAALTSLFDSLHELVTALDLDRDRMSEAAVLEVAAALNVIEDSLKHHERADADLAASLELHARRLRELTDGGPMTDLSGEPLPLQLQSEATTAVAGQLRAALKLAEQPLDAYFRNPDDRSPLQTALTPLHQAAAAFDMLDLPLPTAVARASARLVEYFERAPAVDPELFELVAESLSLLDFHAEALPRPRAESEASLEALLARLEVQLVALPVVDAPATTGPAAADSSDVKASTAEPATALDRAHDAELLEIYLEETEDVLAHVAQHLQTLRVNPTDNDALVEVRRGFHTLKGSGRTVGLKALGEVAWAVEKLLNLVLENGVVPSPAQLGFVEKTSAAFAGWASALRDSGEVELQPAVWQDEAATLESESASQQRAAEAAEVLIDGTRKLSRALYDIFLGEARQHLQALRQGQAELAAQPALAASDAMRRAAHTLASNAGAAGFRSLEELARTVEHWLDVQTGGWSAPTLALVDKCVDTLADMLERAGQQREPKPAPSLITAVQAAAQAASASGQTEVATETTAPEVAAPTVATPARGSAVADQELLTVFIEEARELVPQIGNELRGWHAQPATTEHADTLQRLLHTLKGSARMAGQTALGNAVHGMEDRVMRALAHEAEAADFDRMFASLDRIGTLLEDVLATGEGAPPVTATIAAERATEPRAQFLRVRADALDRLINEAGEISIARSRAAREMLAFKQASFELTDSVQRLRSHLREMEIEAESQLQSRLTQLQEANETFDPLEFDRFTRLQELTRMMAESVNDVATIQQGLLANLDETEAALQQQHRLNRELQHGLMNVRMVPFALITERLQRIVRQTARELGKRVELQLEGEGVELDRSVLDKIGAPLEHLLRNAVAHGMETAAARKKAGKPATGNISLQVRQESDEIILTVSDDGAGINLERVREKAVAQGLLAAEREYDEQTLLSVIFEPGFSTAAKVSQISGRGVGLDAVRSDITALGGRIDVGNMPGRGAVFSVYLPVTLSVSQVVLVRIGQREFAVPAVMVEQVQKLKPELLAQACETGSMGWNGRQYPLHFLGRLIGDAEHVPEEQRYTPVLLLHSGTFHVALHVDEIIGNQEVVMKPIGLQLARAPGIVGATVMGDGGVVLILNPVQLANREILTAGRVSISTAAVPEIADAPLVMVVDDSLTMRKVLGRLLEREGYRVVTARDGMDALQQLQETVPAVMLTDIEMPRMDGFELARNVRGDARTAGVPIIVISSRTAEKHRNLAREIGVDAYFGKPVQDEDLLERIAALLQGAASVNQA